MRGVQADQRVEGGAEEIGADRQAVLVDQPVPLARRCRPGRARRAAIVSSHHSANVCTRPPRSARTATWIVTLLDSRQIDTTIGRSSTSRGVGPAQALADVEEVGDDEDREDRGLGDDQAEHADAAAVGQRHAPARRRRDGAALTRTSSPDRPDASGPRAAGGCARPAASRSCRRAAARSSTTRASTRPTDRRRPACPRRSERTTFQRKTENAAAWKTTPAVREQVPDLQAAVRPRRCRSAAACRAARRSACGTKVRLKPMTKSQKCQRPSRLVEHPAGGLREPVVDGREDREQRGRRSARSGSARRRSRSRVSCQSNGADGQHDAGEAGDQELEEEARGRRASASRSGSCRPTSCRAS